MNVDPFADPIVVFDELTAAFDRAYFARHTRNAGPTTTRLMAALAKAEALDDVLHDLSDLPCEPATWASALRAVRSWAEADDIAREALGGFAFKAVGRLNTARALANGAAPDPEIETRTSRTRADIDG